MKRVLTISAVLVILGISVDSFAGDPIRKLARGLANIGFSPLEIPMKVWDTDHEEGSIAGGTYGVLKGVAYTFARIGVGLTDTVTFLIPLPNCPDDPMDVGWGYGPLMRPEWVVDTEHNAYNIFYQDTAIMD